MKIRGFTVTYRRKLYLPGQDYAPIELGGEVDVELEPDDDFDECWDLTMEQISSKIRAKYVQIGESTKKSQKQFKEQLETVTLERGL